jgi:hypothetical protein
LVNVAASFTFIYFASWTWLEPNLRGEDVARDGDAIVWVMGAFPVLAASVIADGVWFVLVALERAKRGASWPAPSLVIIVAIWVAALLVNWLRF